MESWRDMYNVYIVIQLNKTLVDIILYTKDAKVTLPTPKSYLYRSAVHT